MLGTGVWVTTRITEEEEEEEEVYRWRIRAVSLGTGFGGKGGGMCFRFPLVLQRCCLIGRCSRLLPLGSNGAWKPTCCFCSKNIYSNVCCEAFFVWDFFLPEIRSRRRSLGFRCLKLFSSYGHSTSLLSEGVWFLLNSESKSHYVCLHLQDFGIFWYSFFYLFKTFEFIFV